MPAKLALRQRRALASPRPLSASPALDGRTLNHTMLRVLLLAPLALLLAACDATIPTDGPTGPDPIEPISANESALVTAAFEEVEELFSLGFGDSGSAARAASATGATALASMSARVDTTTYTGVYDAVNAKGFLVQLQYREPQGVGVWVGGLDAVESVTLSFLTYADLVGFVSALQAGSIPYLTGASNDAEASFSTYDTWRVAQVYSPAEGEAVVSYANQELRESVTVREPVATLNTNGTGTLRDGGPDGSVRTRYYGADFAIDAEGNVTGTLLRTLLSSGDTADGSVVSRNDYVNGTFRQTKQRGGDGVVIRENTEG